MSEVHLTVATVVPKNGSYLMVQERDKFSGNLVYNQPAGHVEHGETIQQAAIRETLEETGWEVSLQGLIGIYDLVAANGIHYFRICFAATPTQRIENARIDPDIEQSCWLTYQTILQNQHKIRSPLVLRAIRDFETGTMQPLTIFK